MPHSAAFLFLEETLNTKKSRKGRDSDPPVREEGSVNSQSSTLEAIDSSCSLQSNDSGIELPSSTSLEKVDSDTELIDVTQPEMHDDDLIIVESDIDTDSEFERVHSDTELLFKLRNDSSLGINQGRSSSSRFRVPDCLVTQCGPRQCYGSIRNSLLDTYEFVLVIVKCLKSCSNCLRRRRTDEHSREVADRGHPLRELPKRLAYSVIIYVRLILDRRVFISILLYGTLAFLVVMCNEVCHAPQCCNVSRPRSFILMLTTYRTLLLQ